MRDAFDELDPCRILADLRLADLPDGRTGGHLTNWIDAGPITQLADGQAISVPAGRRMIAVARSGDEFFAIEDICTHDGAELTGGAIEGAEIVCPRHGARFCLRTGQALTPPAYEPVSVFETKIADGRLWVRTSS